MLTLSGKSMSSESNISYQDPVKKFPPLTFELDSY